MITVSTVNFSFQFRKVVNSHVPFDILEDWMGELLW